MMMNRIMCSSKIFTDLSFTNNKDKNVCKIDLQHFSSKNVLAKHKEAFLSINGLHLLKLEKGIIELSQTKIKIKNYFKQIPVPFKIYDDFESNLVSVEIYEEFNSKRDQDLVPCIFAYKVVFVDDRFSKLIFAFRGENAAFEFIKAILKEYEYCKKVMKKHFKKNLIKSGKEEEQFQPSNTCWICEKLIDNEDEKVRDLCHITGKLRGAAH